MRGNACFFLVDFFSCVWELICVVVMGNKFAIQTCEHQFITSISQWQISEEGYLIQC
jgi:hypothetical protein